MIEKLVLKAFTDKKKLLNELSFYKSFLEESGITKYSKAFKNYARGYTVELLNSQDRTSQLNIAKPHVKNLLTDLFAEMKGVNYQINLQITFRKEIKNDEKMY